ncbi:MAG: Asp-tRNA(Asn)/Glu-tRNA(Gln) amidotransferase subunit GatB [Candidatus Liptonbacteria bacterium]|nr:Asp-tRNA(Asn)/Glu-tRNA(Gln) amidotransferase subunit GatB [Candidatus Liptonbacteria bacterium]
MAKYYPTIGLEIHSELATASKMFCDCKNDPEEFHPNINVCPICLAHPGTLPVPNKKAIELLLKVGMALGGEIAKISKFDRKNYFYPDLPKGYQISQYDMPFVKGGELAGVKITRVHLEEDTGSLLHGGPSASSGRLATLVDFNRAGIPLMELVTEPVIHDVETAVKFAKELQLVLRYLGASNADMEKGQMRLEANVSISKLEGLRQSEGLSGQTDSHGKSVLGTKVELKNINSFKAMESAVKYELDRQAKILEDGGKIHQETRGWDDNKKSTVLQRSKESAHDYRYFPDPDIPPLDTHKLFDLELLRTEIPELPEAKRRRFAEEYSISGDRLEILISDIKFSDYFEKSASEFLELLSEGKKEEKISYDLLFNYLTHDLRGLLNDEGLTLEDVKFEPEDFAHLVYFAQIEKIGSRAAKDILKKMVLTGGDPENILKEEGLEQISHEAELQAVVLEVIKENPDAVSQYKKGKENALQFLIGKAMAKLKGKGNPQILQSLLKKSLSG